MGTSRRGLTERISRVLLLQAGAIAIAAVIGVYLAGVLLKDVLITQALREEARHFWDKRDGDPDFPLPDTLNLTGYMAGDARGRGPTPALAALPLGFHSVAGGEAEFSTVYISERAGRRLFLVFDGERVDALATWYGLVPLTVVLLVLYLSVYFMYRASQRAVSPLGRLAREVDRLDPETPDPNVFRQVSFTGSEEAQVLAGALAGFTQRLNTFVERERNFTRDASHELRSPLTVIRLATDMLQAQPDLAEDARVDLERIQRSANDMEELLQAFLLLARESETGLETHEVCINDIVQEELQHARLLAQDKPIDASTVADCVLFVEAPNKALSILFGNLIRNAFAYTDAGRVRIHVRDGEVSIEDSGLGMNPQQVEVLFQPFQRAFPTRGNGHGVGLSIVKRISERFDWPLQVESSANVGTRVTVRFPSARAEQG